MPTPTPSTIPLDGRWELRSSKWSLQPQRDSARIARSARGWMPARVPGEVHLDLIRAGRMVEPLIGDQAPACRWPETKCWWYRRPFNVPAAFLRHERQRLIFDGLDLHARVFLNGVLIGTAANAFIPAEFDVASALRPGRNELLVCLTAGSELAQEAAKPGTPADPAWRNPAADGEIPNPAKDDPVHGHRTWHGYRWLRKPAFAYGWDWIEPLPNIGITGSVRLQGRSHAVLHELRMDTIRKGRRVFLETEAVVENLHPWAEQAGVLEIRIAPPGKGRKAILRRYALALPVGRSAVRDLVEIPDPQLWWPNGMGPQPLYHVTARVLDGRTRCDGREMQVGLRTIRIDRAALADGSRFCFRVNGEKVFCKGADWGPADALLPRVSREKYARLVAEAKGAHFNMFRVNGVGNYEPAAFYDACDRAGILVWQDFNFSCTTYPDHLADFRNGVREEAEQVIAALRHHPCVALWCGANENIWGFEGWWNPQKTQPLHLGGTILYNQVLPDACRRMDPHRAYWPCSPFGGERPNGEDAGDCHWWTFMKSDPDQWISHEIYDQCKARFVSEFGAIGPCHMDSIRQYLRPADRRLDCLAWRRHTNQCEQGKTGRGIAFHYVQPDGLSLADYVLYGQMFQAQLLGRAVEALRFRKNDPDADCQGALVWSYSEPWGETGWSLIDYYCRRKASYYWYRRACKPVKVIVRRRGDSLVTRLINDRLAPVEGVVEVGWFRVDGTRRRTRQVAVVAGANSAVHVAAERIPGPDLCDPRQWLYAAVFRGGAAGADDDQCIWPLAPHRQLQSVKPAIQATPAPGGWIVTGNVYCPGVHFNDHGRAVLSDNYFDLLPGVPYRIARVDGGNGLPKMHAIPPGTG